MAARQAIGLRASDIAARLGMSTRQIEALERGDWKVLPGQAFVRGALRSYGKSVGVDVEPLLASIGGQVHAPELRASSSLDAAMPYGGTLGFGSGGSGSRVAWIVLGVAAVIAMALYFGEAFDLGESANTVARVDTAAGSNSASGTTNAGAAAGSQPDRSGAVVSPRVSSTVDGTSAAAGSTATAAGISAAASAAGLAPLAPLTPLAPLGPADAGSAAAGSTGVTGSTGATATGARATADGAGGNTVATGAAPSLGPAVAAQPAAAAGGSVAGASAASTSPASASGTLQFRFGREAWVDIRDGSGKVLLNGLQAPGSSRELRGTGPFKLVIGNAQHVTLERGGQRIDLGSRARSGVARLTLD